MKNLDELIGTRRYPSSRGGSGVSTYRWFNGTWVPASSFLAIKGPARINAVLGAPVYTCLFHYFGKDGSKTTRNLLSDLSSLTQSTSAIISRTQACPVLESHIDTCTGDQERVSSLPQNPPWAHGNRSSMCIY